jgi:hypothetical protein
MGHPDRKVNSPHDEHAACKRFFDRPGRTLTGEPVDVILMSQCSEYAARSPVMMDRRYCSRCPSNIARLRGG